MPALPQAAAQAEEEAVRGLFDTPEVRRGAWEYRLRSAEEVLAQVFGQECRLVSREDARGHAYEIWFEAPPPPALAERAVDEAWERNC